MKNIHIIPTDKPSRLCIDNSCNELNYSEIEGLNSKHITNQHIYITSDEEIKEGDWFLWKDTEYPYLFKCIGLTDEDSLQVKNTLTGELGTYHRNPKDSDYGDWYRCYSKKIILTTDQDLIKDGVQAIDDEFLEWFVENPTYEEVEVYEVNGKLFAEPIIPQESPETENIQKTALEYLFEQLWETPKDKFTWNAILEKAKEMEKEQNQILIDEALIAYGFIKNK
jgi:hypothetical protein